jgi:c-di-GMP-related signal transduction protein
MNVAIEGALPASELHATDRGLQLFFFFYFSYPRIVKSGLSESGFGRIILKIVKA